MENILPILNDEDLSADDNNAVVFAFVADDDDDIVDILFGACSRMVPVDSVVVVDVLVVVV